MLGLPHFYKVSWPPIIGTIFVLYICALRAYFFCTSVHGDFHVQNPKENHDIREGGVRMSGKDTASGLRAHVHNQEFG
jgi:hypothetical protein